VIFLAFPPREACHPCSFVIICCIDARDDDASVLAARAIAGKRFSNHI
jgi:hypothetical protein